MNNRDKCIAILNDLNESQLANIVTLLQATKNAIDEASEAAYCEILFKQYEADPDKDEFVDLTDVAKQLGIQLQ